jgi:polyketide synthase PksN
MNKEEILLAYRSGKLTIAEAKQKLHELRNPTLKRPLSEGQKGLWMLQKTSPNMSAYNVPICFRVGRKLELDKFQQACRLVLEQYPILNTVIGEDQGVPYQIIQPAQPLFFEIEDISNLSPHEILSYLRNKVKIPFRLEQGPLMRVHLFTQSNEEEQIVLINIHHIVFDGSSLLVFVTKLLTIYQDLLQNKVPELTTSSTSYTDFVEWEQAMLASKAGAEHLAYWKQQLSGTLPVLELPTDHPRSSAPSFEGQVHTKLLSPELADQIKACSDSLQINRSVMFLGLFKVLIHRYTNQDDLIIGLPTFGRSQDRFSSLIGYFINMIPIRSQVVGSRPFSDYVRELQLTLVDGLDHAEYPFPALVRALNVPRTPGTAPVFQVIFLYQNFIQANSQEDDSNRLPFEFIEEIHQEGEYELELEVFEQSDTFRLHFKYNPELFEEETIARMVEHYLILTTEVMKDPNTALDSYSFLSEAETQKILIDWNATKIDYPKEKCIHELFEEQVQKTPDAIAVIFEDETLTYRDLDQKSTQLAIYLQKQGVKPDSLVGICVERHWEMIVGLLGILKAGGAFVPLDPDYPVERLEYMLENSKVSVLLTQARLMKKISHLLSDNLKAVILDKDWADIQDEAKTVTLKREVNCEHLAYVIYTSGSTGKPKGVMIPHRALTNFLISMSQKPGLNSQDKLLAVTTFCFDIAGLELYLPLINGARVYICSSEKAKDVEKLKREIHKCQPTIMQATPVTWTMLFRTGWRNEERIKILCGGEALSETLKQSFMNNQCELWNMFGPTETTIWSTIEYIREAESITLGKPIANTRIYIVDRNFKPTPIGIPGELCIAGDGLARGYLNQPELTAERFVANPFDYRLQSTEYRLNKSKTENLNLQSGICNLESHSRMYRTGDLARWTIDGKIEFLGRLDHQVKIRGFRIELGEIESQLATHPDIQDCAVIVKEQTEHKQLAAFYIAKKPLGQQQLRAYLKPKLPEYMLPSFFIEIAQMPLTPNGKHDRKALANHPVSTPKTVEPGAKPHFATVEKVLNIWKEVLNRNDIGVEDGFFDVGGDSFLAVTVAQRIKDSFECDFNVTELFQYTNVKEISNYISKIKGVAESPTSINIRPEGTDHQKNITFDPLLPSTFARARTHPPYYQNSVALIGISCRFPGAKNYFEFWNNLRAGTESIKFFSKEELASLNIPKELVENPNFIPVQATIDDKDFFDANFFSISPRDAGYMDPQFRLLLLHSWKAVEDAGYTPKQIPETSVFMSAGNHLYSAILSDMKRNSTETIDFSEGYISWLIGQGGTIPTMISHKFGFKGPSFFVHSNCSSSLVELHLAFQSLCSGEAKYALVGAASISPLSNVGYIYEKGLNFAGDGHVKAFDASADGMVGGEGVAVIVLKKAIDAVQDGDHIYALLRGTGVNNDGSDKVGFYAPSVKGQAEVIKRVLDSTQIHPESISYIEAHGTGTKLGDPIEVAALNDIYQQYTSRKQFCGIGSVKTNIGHLDTAAGLAGCIKVALSLYYHEIPPSINYREPNPNLNLNNSPFYIVDQLLKLEKNTVPYRAALSSFGIGGTNTHAIFEEYLESDETQFKNVKSNPASFIIPLSAKNDERLKVYAQELMEFLKAKSFQPGLDLNCLAYTLQVGREAMESRVVFIVKDKNELIHKLEEFIGGNQKFEGCFTGKMNQVTAKIQLFENEADTKEIIQKWFNEGQGRKLAELWINGFQIPWDLLYSDPKPRRMSLPTYPFAGEYYGLPKLNLNVTNKKSSIQAKMRQLSRTQVISTLEKEETYETMTFEEVWQEKDLPDVGTLGNSRVKPQTLVCFLSNPENQQLLDEVFRTYYEQVEIIFASQSSSFQKYSPKKYEILRNDRNSYQEAFQNIGIDYGKVDGILYLWPLEDSSCIHDYAAIVYMFQSLGAAKLKVNRILFAAQFKNGLEKCYLESWIGFERSLGIVLPNTQIAAIFQPNHELNQETLKDWADKIWKEMQTQKIKSVLYQNQQRYIYQIQRTTLASGNISLKPGGTYLITGGCGGLGFIFAEHLAKQSNRNQVINLILTGRSPLDAEKQSKIKTLEDLGSQVIYIQADVSNLSRMKKGLNQAKARFGNINGVIHAAGISSNQSIFAKELSSFEKVLEPKINGTLVLDELLQDQTLDFICYFSSSAAILGDVGSCDYAIANRFLMAYAHYRNLQQQKGARQGKAIVINWPLWKDGGMGFKDDDNTKMYLKSSGQSLLETREGLAVFDRIMAQIMGTPGLAQHLIICGQPSRVKRFLGITQEQPVTSSLTIPSAVTNRRGNVRGRTLELKGFSIEQYVEWDLKNQVSQLLKISRDKLGRDDNLADFGFDSISLAEFANKLTKYYEIEISPALFFGYSTIEKLTQYFLTEYPEKIREFYREDIGEIEPEIKPGPLKVSVIRTGLKQRLNRSRFAVGNFKPNVSEPIAIIGMSGRFPGARNIEELWTILATGQDMVREIPLERFDWRQFYSASAEPGKTNCKWSGCVPGVSEFEPLFFEIYPKEAESMDPRQRLLLQEAWKALEDAGYGSEQIRSEKIGMFVGVEQGDYQFIVKGEGGVTSNNNAILASRLAYFLNLNGPVMAIDTACSSGLVAAHQAILSLWNGDCDTAIVAGVNLMLTPGPYIGMSQAGMLSKDGKCYAFDKRANGMVPGEAVAVVIIKRLSRAQADGDPIYAIIRGSGVNYDGKTNGITAPSGVSQTKLLKTIYDQYQINPEEIEYIVTHGTGTKLGDPIEINALYDVFKDYTQKQNYCALTSTKTNFGHTLAASGLVSLISLVQALRYETIPASLHCEQENDYINWKQSPFYVNKANRPWPGAAGGAGGRVRIGAVSAFGMSGTNAHMVVQSYSKEEKGSFRDQAPYYLLAISAKTPEALAEKVTNMIEVLQNQVMYSYDLSQISYTLLEGRQHFQYRCAAVIQDRENAIYLLKQIKSNEKVPNLFKGKVPLDFSGQKGFEQFALDLLNQSVSFHENSPKYQEMLSVLADLYCQGYDLDWKLLFGGVKQQRVHLPTYPFSRECYWVRENQFPTTQSFVTVDNKQTDQGTLIKTSTQLTNLQEITNTLVEIITNITGYKTTEVNPLQKLQELSFDSIIILKITQAITKQFPFLDSTAESDKLLLLMTTEVTIYELADYLHQKSSEMGPKKEAEASDVDLNSPKPDLNEMNIIPKKDPQNVMCSELKISRKSPYTISGKLIVDETNPFFFDHPLDHIPGLQLIAAMSELTKNGYLSQHNLEPQTPLFISEIAIKFHNYCKKQFDTDIKAAVVPQTKKNNPLFFQSEVIQKNKIIANGNFTITKCPTKKIANSARARNRLINPIEIGACDQRIVNKNNALNVFISDKITGNDPQDIGFYLFPQPNNQFFQDFPGEFIDTVVLLEACRQTSRAFGYFLSEKGNSQAGSLGLIPILKSVNIKLKRPIYKQEQVFFKKANLDLINIGSNIMLEVKGIIIIDSSEIGFYEITSMILTTDFVANMEPDTRKNQPIV